MPEPSAIDLQCRASGSVTNMFANVMSQQAKTSATVFNFARVIFFFLLSFFAGLTRLGVRFGLVQSGRGNSGVLRSSSPV